MGLSKSVSVIVVSSVVLVAVAIAVAVTVNKKNDHDHNAVSTSNKAVQVMCEPTDYKDACVKSLSSSNSDDPKELLKTGFKAAMNDIGDVIGKSKTLEDASKDSRTKEAYGLCKDLLETSVNDLDRSMDKVGKFEPSKMEEYVADIKAWLTGAIDYQETCIDAFENTTGDAGEKMKDLLKMSNELSSNALAMVSDLKSIVSSLNIPGLHRRLFDYDYGPHGDPPPSLDPASGGSRRLFDYDYGPHGDPPPSLDPSSGGSRRLFDYDYGPHGDPPPSLDPSSGGARRLFDYDYGPRGDPPPSLDPSSGGARRLFDYDYGPHGDPPPSEDPGWGVSTPTRKLDPASGGSRRLFDYDYGPHGDPPPSEDPGWGLSTPTRKLDPASGGSRRLFDYDYGPHGDPPPSEDPGWGLSTPTRKLDPASGGSRRLFDYDYGPHGDPPPSEDPGWGLSTQTRKLDPASGGSRRLFDYDYGPHGDPPPSEDPGWGLSTPTHKLDPASGGSRRLFDYDYGPHGDPPPSEDPGWGLSTPTRKLVDAAYGPPSDQSLIEDPGQGAASTVRQLFGNDNKPPSDDGNPSHDSDSISKDHKVVSLDDVPGWVGTHQRSLLQANLKPNAVVALDGSGQFKSINEALKSVPPNNVKAYVILVKAGVYKEYVDVPRRVDNVVMIGEGATKTKITGNKNFIDGVGTFKTATFAVNGNGFMAKDMSFENSAGAAKHQAVALRVSGDRAIFFQCQMDGFQDTLYTHTYRQFYRDCTISGTIDFIFGDAAVIFQNCKMIVRKPMDNQACMVTAQGRKDSRSTGGNILQNCYITGEPAVMQAKPPVKSYLGRPWKEYSRTVIMQSFIDANIVPEGWSPWTGTFGMDTCYYAEYQNRGPGSDTSKRVTWKGIQKNPSQQAMLQFTAGKFVQGDAWIPVAGIPYDPGMMKV